MSITIKRAKIPRGAEMAPTTIDFRCLCTLASAFGLIIDPYDAYVGGVYLGRFAFARPARTDHAPALSTWRIIGRIEPIALPVVDFEQMDLQFRAAYIPD